jgi:nucleoid-associated protein YgaU
MTEGYKGKHKQTPAYEAEAGQMRARGWVVTGIVVLGYLTTCGTLAWAAVGLLHLPRAAARLDVLVGLAACTGAVVVATWLAVAAAVALAATAAAPASRLHRLARRIAPAAVRRLAALALGAGLAGSTVCAAGPAAAVPTAAVTAAMATAAGVPSAPSAAPGLPRLDRPADELGGWTPDRPAPPGPRHDGGPVRLVTTAPRAGTSVVEDVVVRRDDTLWDIAARHLGPGASAAEIAAEWPRWHRANRDLVGPDPDLIRPGQRLTPPPR